MKTRRHWLALWTLLIARNSAHAEIIDDSEWNTFSLQLSDGWNMARPSQIEALNGTEVEDMREYGLGNFFNASISWTRKEQAWNEIRFAGSDIDIHGVRSPLSGEYVVILDDRQVARDTSFSMTFTPNASIFRTGGLDPEVVHRLRLVNGNGTMYFDHAEVTNKTALTLPPKPSATGLIVASAIVTTTKPTKSVSPADAMINMGLDPVKIASLAHEVGFEWNWRVYFTIAFSGLMAIICMLLILSQVRKDRQLRSRVSRSFFPSAPAGTVQRIKGFKPTRKSVATRPKQPASDIESQRLNTPAAIAFEKLTRARSGSIDSVTGAPIASRQLTLAEALREERSADARAGHVLQRQDTIRPMF